MLKWNFFLDLFNCSFALLLALELFSRRPRQLALPQVNHQVNYRLNIIPSRILCMIMRTQTGKLNLTVKPRIFLVWHMLPLLILKPLTLSEIYHMENGRLILQPHHKILRPDVLVHKSSIMQSLYTVNYLQTHNQNCF